MVNIYIRLFLIPMPFCILLMLLDFCPFESSRIAFFLEFGLVSSIHSALLCERYFDFKSRTEKKFWAILFKLILFSMYFDISLLLGIFWLLLAFWLSFVTWDHLNTIQLLTLLPLHGSFVVSFLEQTLVWSEWSLKIVFWTFLTLVILQGLNMTWMCS